MLSIAKHNKLNNYNNHNNKQLSFHSTRKLNSEMSLTQNAFGGLKFNFINNPLSEVEKCTGIIIKQEPEYLEFISGFERNIMYHIFGETPQRYKYLFK